MNPVTIDQTDVDSTTTVIDDNQDNDAGVPDSDDLVVTSGDHEAPTIHLNTNVFINGGPLNGNVILSAEAYDNDEIMEIVITVTPMSLGWEMKSSERTEVIHVAYTSNWRYELDTSGLTNMGSYTVGVKAIDKSGNESEEITKQFTLLRF